MGRLSMLLDMTLTVGNDFLIVCDRDEKIQVSSYPECYNIVAFCLGHQQFVTSILALDQFDDRLVSAEHRFTAVGSSGAKDKGGSDF